MEDSVLIDRLGPVALAVTAHVGRNDVEACLWQRLDQCSKNLPPKARFIRSPRRRWSGCLASKRIWRDLAASYAAVIVEGA
jgi:hypothetical protein